MRRPSRGLLLLTLLAVACASESPDTETESPTSTSVPTSSTDGAADTQPTAPAQTTSSFPISAHRTDGGGGMGAIVTGIVEVDADLGCVWLSDADGSRHPAVWPFILSIRNS